MVKLPKWLRYLPVLKNPLVSAAVICAVVVYAGVVSVQSRNPFASLFSDNEICLLVGTVVSNPAKTSAFNGSYRTDIAVEKIVAKSGATSSAGGVASVFFPSAVVESLYPGKLYTVAKRQGGILIETGAHLSLSVRGGYSEHEFVVTSATELGWGSGFFSRVRYFRALCRLQFKRLLYSWGKAGGLLLALLSGSREYTEGIVSDSFRNAGLSHILALSGMHLSLFSGLALFLGKKAASRTIADGLQLGAILFFVWFAGISPSLFRAMLCSLILFGSSLLRMNRPTGLSVLSASFLLHLMLFPGHLQSAAFMLSYGALAGILLIGVPVRRLFSRRFLPKLTSALSDSAGAQMFTAPITLRLFGKLMPVGIFASVVVSPLVVFFLYAGLLGIMLCLMLPFLSPAIGAILNWFYELIKSMTVFFAGFPALTV
ncbi:MAG: ComEC/Rec2 family competence protein [Treponema sp.]|nr:ComEC/Rec2 family competence protein [Treponema sp.]